MEATLVHPMFDDGSFVFVPEPSTTRQEGYKTCVACGRYVVGSMYSCGDAGLVLHPCCARLPERILLVDDGTVLLQLCQGSPSPCLICGDKKRETHLAYSGEFDGVDLYLHLACLKYIAAWRRVEEEEASATVAGDDSAWSWFNKIIAATDGGARKLLNKIAAATDDGAWNWLSKKRRHLYHLQKNLHL